MVASVQIKETNGEMIYISNIILHKLGILNALAGWIGLFILSEIIGYLVVMGDASRLDIFSTSGIAISVLLASLLFPLLAISQILDNSVPAYKVWLSGVNKSISIIKTTPEADQVAICKAVQELELKSNELVKQKLALDKEKQELMEIALKCK